jgi:hypothetical protein
MRSVARRRVAARHDDGAATKVARGEYVVTSRKRLR